MPEDKYYSKKNPLGPYAGRATPDAPASAPSDYIEGCGTKKNLAEWADYAHRNSNPNREPSKRAK